MDIKEMLSCRVDAPEMIRKQAIEEAKETVLDLTNRTVLPNSMNALVVSLAAVYAHRMLAAGEDSRTEGGVSVSYAYSKEVPEDIMQRILSKRKLKQAGVANATKEY